MLPQSKRQESWSWELPAVAAAGLAQLGAIVERGREMMPLAWQQAYREHNRQLAGLAGKVTDAAISYVSPQLEAQFRAANPWVARLEQAANRRIREHLQQHGQSHLAGHLRAEVFGGNARRPMRGPAWWSIFSSPFATHPYHLEWAAMYPHLFSVNLVGGAGPGVTAHELGHLIQRVIDAKHPYRLTWLSAGRSVPGLWLPVLAGLAAPDPVTAYGTAAALTAMKLPVIANEIAASAHGARLLQEVLPHVGRWRPFLGVPAYVTGAMLPLAAVSLARHGMNRPLDFSAYREHPWESGLLAAGLTGMAARNILLRPLAIGSAYRLPRLHAAATALYNALGNPLRLLVQSKLTEAVPGAAARVWQQLPRKLGLPGVLTGLGLGLHAWRKYRSGATDNADAASG